MYIYIYMNTFYWFYFNNSPLKFVHVVQINPVLSARLLKTRSSLVVNVIDAFRVQGPMFLPVFIRAQCNFQMCLSFFRGLDATHCGTDMQLNYILDKNNGLYPLFSICVCKLTQHKFLLQRHNVYVSDSIWTVSFRPAY
jgi:hypothetical protein